MKKLISQFCTLSILATSLNTFSVPAAFAQDSSRTNEIRNIMAKYSSDLQRAESTVKALTEATIAIQSQGITSQEILDYEVAGMDKAEGEAYRASMQARMGLVTNENVGELVKEVAGNVSKGSNFFGCSNNMRLGTWAAGLSALIFIATSSAKYENSKTRQEEIKAMKLEKTDLESDIRILIGEGVKPESFLIASIQKDINYLNEQSVQAQQNSDEDKASSKNFAIAGGVAGTLATIGFFTSCY